MSVVVVLGEIGNGGGGGCARLVVLAVVGSQVMVVVVAVLATPSGSRSRWSRLCGWSKKEINPASRNHPNVN